MDYSRHGLSGEMKRRVFDALFEMQQGRCAICGISQDDLKTRQYADGPTPLPVAYRMLYIDHCHESGCIRGLLCNQCNDQLGHVENFGLFRHYATPAFKYRPPCPYLADCIERERWYGDNWMDLNRDSLLQYMQRERWFPRKDILFHLQAQSTP